MDGQPGGAISYSATETGGHAGAVIGGWQLPVEVHPHAEAVLDEQDHQRGEAVRPQPLHRDAAPGASTFTHSMILPPAMSNVWMSRRSRLRRLVATGSGFSSIL